MAAGADGDGAVAAGGLDEPLDGPAGVGLDLVGDGEGGEYDGEVGLDRFAFVVARCRSASSGSLVAPAESGEAP